MTEKRNRPRYVLAALATTAAAVLLFAACEAPVPTDPAELADLTAGKQLTQVDPGDDLELARILEEDGELTLAVEFADGETFLVDAVELRELKESGHAEVLIGKLREHKEQLRLTVIHEDGSEAAYFGDPSANELVEFKQQQELRPHAEGELRYRYRTGSTVNIERLEASETVQKKKEAGASQ